MVQCGVGGGMSSDKQDQGSGAELDELEWKFVNWYIVGYVCVDRG